jgi:Tfp pilus assembly protein PilO
VTRSGEIDFWQIIGLVFSLLASVFVMYMAYAVVINWCKERKAFREEQEKLERGANEHT